MSRNGSLKVLDHALAGPEGRDNCNKFVDILGLRTVFPLFMKTPKRKRLLTVDQHEGTYTLDQTKLREPLFERYSFSIFNVVLSIYCLVVK